MTMVLRPGPETPLDAERPADRVPSTHKPPPAEHAVSGAMFDAVGPGYWPRSLSLRVVISVSYFLLVPAGLLPMSTGWWLGSAGTLVMYSAAMLGLYLQQPRSLWLHKTVAPYVDVIMVTVATVAVGMPAYPIWIGYFLIISSLSAMQTTRYMLVFACGIIAQYWAGAFVLDLSGRAAMAPGLQIVVSIMAVFMALNSDLIATSNRKLRDLVLQASLTDPLTGLANRRHFREVLDSHAVAEPRPLAVLMYDLDNFKALNEEFGHIYADDVLVKVCDELRDIFRDADSVARYGGDELVVLAHVSSTADAVMMGERSLERVRDKVGVSMSVGVAVYPLTTVSLEGTVRAADDALGRAKRGGKARVVAAQLPQAA